MPTCELSDKILTPSCSRYKAIADDHGNGDKRVAIVLMDAK